MRLPIDGFWLEPSTSHSTAKLAPTSVRGMKFVLVIVKDANSQEGSSENWLIELFISATAG
jgi:hypothetical protein